MCLKPSLMDRRFFLRPTGDFAASVFAREQSRRVEEKRALLNSGDSDSSKRNNPQVFGADGTLCVRSRNPCSYISCE